jgi:hypothetical protein
VEVSACVNGSKIASVFFRGNTNPDIGDGEPKYTPVPLEGLPTLVN